MRFEGRPKSKLRHPPEQRRTEIKLNLVYNITELRDLAKRFPGAVIEETRKTMDLVTVRLESEVVQRTPMGVGGSAGLSGSIFGESVESGMQVVGIVGTPLEYGEVIESGRRPGARRPPTSALLGWVRSILGITDEKEKASAAYVISRSIGIKGFKGVHMFENALTHLEDWIQSEFYKIPGKVVKATGKH